VHGPGPRRRTRGSGPSRRARSGLAKGLLGVGVGAALLTGLTGSGGASGPAGPLTLYSGQHVQTTQALADAFTKKTGIQVNIRFDDEAVLADQMVTEGSHSPADVFYTENSPPLELLSSKHMLARVNASTLATSPSRFSSPKGEWVGVSARVSVMVYNTTLLRPSQLPTSVMQLAQPKWRGKVAVSGGETDFQPIVTSVVAAHGEKAALSWLLGLKANAAGHLYPSNEVLTDEVNRGQVALGLINEYYWYRERARVGAAGTHSAIAYFAPQDVGYVIDVSGAGILKSSQHRAAAQRFLAFVTSVQGQQIIAHDSSFEYPIASGVHTAQPLTAFSQLQPNHIGIAQLGTGAEAVKLLQQAQLL
jgi:iron(III) transport system substrate-binding protein